MRAPLLLLGIGLTALAAGCSRSGPAPLSPVQPAAVIYRDDSGGLRDSAEYVVRGEREWGDIWTRITEAQLNPQDRPQVDFTNSMLLVVAAGPMQSGDRIRWDSVGVRKDVYHAFVSLVTACEAFDVEVYPLEIVRVPKDERPVTFQRTHRRAEGCSK